MTKTNVGSGSQAGARRPADPKAMKSGSGFHSASRYLKRDRRAGKRPAADD